VIDRSQYYSVPLAVGLQWAGGGGMVVSGKMDGTWCGSYNFGPHVLVCEKMRAGFYVAHDLRVLDFEPVTTMPTAERWRALQELSRNFPPHTCGLLLLAMAVCS